MAVVSVSDWFGLAEADPRGVCLSCGKSADADVLVFLCAASVVTSSAVQDWLKDRWQAAKDMSGSPIPGPHWVSVQLDDSQSLHSVVLDWETAFADDWALSVRKAGEDTWIDVFDRAKWPSIYSECGRRNKNTDTTLCPAFNRCLF